MANNQLFDAMYALSPKYLLRFNDASGNALDSSGNGLDFTVSGAGATYAQTGPLYTTKNDAATNKVCAISTVNFTRSITDTTENIATTGVTWVGFVKGSTAGGTFDPYFDTRNTTSPGRNGLALVANERYDAAGTSAWATLWLTDNSGNRSKATFNDTGDLPWWKDGLWHLVVVRARQKQSGVSNEILTVSIDGIDQYPDQTNSAFNVATGSFAAPGGTQKHAYGLYWNGGADSADKTFGIVGWYNKILTKEQELTLLNAATYTVGSSAYGYASAGLNGYVHKYAESGVYASDGIGGSREAAVGEYVINWDNSNGSMAAINNAADNTCPKLWIDNQGRRGLMFDGVTQGLHPFLTVTTPFTANAARMSMMACAQNSSCGNKAGSSGPKLIAHMNRASASANALALQIHYDYPGLLQASGSKYVTATTLPAVPCMPSPGVFGATTGTGGKITTDMTAWCRGVSSAIDSADFSSFYYKSLDGDLTIGSLSSAEQFSGLLHELLVINRPLHANEVAALTAYWNHKWGVDAQDTHIQVFGDSISNAVPNSGNVTNCQGWQANLSGGVSRRTSWTNASWDGAQSGALTKVGGGAFGGNGDDVSARSVSYGKWAARGHRNVETPASDILIFAAFTNDCGHADQETSGDVSPQSITNYQTWRTAALLANPKAKIVVILPPATHIASLNTNDGKATGNGIVAWFTAHPEMADKVIQPTGMSVWVHPTSADYIIMGRLMETGLLSIMNTVAVAGRVPKRSRFTR